MLARERTQERADLVITAAGVLRRPASPGR
jgi:hypothetical protein